MKERVLKADNGNMKSSHYLKKGGERHSVLSVRHGHGKIRDLFVFLIESVSLISLSALFFFSFFYYILNQDCGKFCMSSIFRSPQC